MTWDESKHPRRPAGSPSGGEFTRTQRFLSELEKRFPDKKTPSGLMRSAIGPAFVLVEPGYRDKKATVNLSEIWSSGAKGEGAGSAALKTITRMADKAGVGIDLEPQAFRAGKNKGHALSDQELRSWYERHGFKRSGDKMTRKPKKEKP
ncbi:MAG: hypothetical protein IPN11_14485 [Opitutaceae bacterium]|nr:hypothetical protein [Opitutaceae bacterium]